LHDPVQGGNARANTIRGLGGRSGEHTQETLRFLADRRLTYVSIDAPRSRATVPSLAALTTETAVFRLHGRYFQGHLAQLQGKSPTVAEKYEHF
jgi:uncharacterized protein YecE (DUF72 family)